MEGLGDGSDKLVTVDVNPKSKRYGKVIHSVSTGARVEAHHMGFTDDRRQLWAGGLSDNRIWVFDIATDPARPKLVRTIAETAEGGDGYGYDLAVNPKKNVLLTSSFTGYANYMRPLGELIKDGEAMKKFGNTMVLWDLKAIKPRQVLSVPGTPLEIRWSLNPKARLAEPGRRRQAQVKVAAILAALLAAPALAHHVELPPLDFTPPAPGRHVLHRIMPAPEGRVVGLDGRSERLSRYTREQITLLGFIYTTCVDPQGCPHAYRVFDALKEAIVAAPPLHGKVRLVTLSFDPARDTPDVMRRYAGSRARDAGAGLSWYFLTTRSVHDLLPLVEGFGQDVQVSVDRSSGKARRELSHVLKVFLIDRAGHIREIYSSTFLHPQTVLNDVQSADKAKQRPALLDRPWGGWFSCSASRSRAQPGCSP